MFLAPVVFILCCSAQAADDMCPGGRFLTGWKKHDYLSWRSSFACAMTMSEKFNRTFVLPETFWHYGEDVALDEGVNVQRMMSYGGGRSTVARNADFRAVQEQYPDIYNSYKTLPDRPGMGHCDQMENVLSGPACVARSTAHNVHMYCEQQPFGACFPPDAAYNFVAAAPIVEKAVSDQVRHLGRYIYFSYSPELPFDAAMQAIEGLETNLTTYGKITFTYSTLRPFPIICCLSMRKKSVFGSSNQNRR